MKSKKGFQFFREKKSAERSGASIFSTERKNQRSGAENQFFRRSRASIFSRRLSTLT